MTDSPININTGVTGADPRRAASGIYATSAKKTISTGDEQTLDKQAFLALLVAQMRYQDPTSPMDTTEMMAQSTQMASMEQLTAVADTTRESFALQMRVAASAMLGQEVAWTDADNKVQTGTVSGVDFSGAVPTVRVGDKDVPLDAISAVRSPRPTDGSATTTPTDGSSSSSTTA